MKSFPGLPNFGTKRISENGLAPTATPNLALVGVFLISSIAIGLALNLVAGRFLPNYVIFGIAVVGSTVISAFVSSWMTTLEQKAAEKKNAANAGIAAQFEDREIEARRARAAKGGKQYK